MIIKQNKMALEIEKRWLCKYTPEAKYDEQLDISQCYVKGERYRMSYSHKTKETSFYKTVKKEIKPGVNEEVEEKVSAEVFWENMDVAERVISKTRYIKKDKKLKWELDVFREISIVILEVEVPDEETLKSIQYPKWIEDSVIMDITGMKQFSNFNLAHKV